ncbi:MAG: hypothetical protein HY575_03330 [candidate division NC10 bacterium]|nr:hypothetical protein [candidate division NC10 bacterium]
MGAPGVEHGNVPRVFIAPRALHRLKLYIDLCPFEVGGLGTVEQAGEDVLVTDIVLIRQRASDSDTELDPQAVAEYLLQTVREGKDPSALRLWWHSHAEADVTWSDTDERTIAGLRIDQLVSIVGNKRHEFACRLDHFSPGRVTLHRLPLISSREEESPDEESLREQVMAELREKVILIHREYSEIPEIFFNPSGSTLEIPITFDEADPPDQG